MSFSRRILALGAACALGLSGAVAWALPAGAQPFGGGSPVRMGADTPPPLPAGAVRLGPLAPGTMLHVDVTLKVRDPAALGAFAAGVTTQNSPLFGHFLRPGQFGPRFGAALSSIAAVAAALRQAGLSPGQVPSDRLSIPVTASAAAVEHAFGTSLVRYRLPGGRIAFRNSSAPTIAALAAPFVSGVLGLSDLYLMHPMLARPTPTSAVGHPARGGHPFASATAAGPQPCAAARSAGASFGAFTANLLARYYLMSPLYKLGDLGRGVRVALFELEPNLTSDISAYEHCYGVSAPVTYTHVDGGSGSGAGSGEAALDIEDVIGLSPKVTVDVYQGPNGTDANIFDTYRAIINADRDKVISTSWGDCEANTNPTLVKGEQTLFEQAVAQGQTVFAAAGDTGSTGCLRDASNRSVVSAGDPAAQPDVIGVGGTSIGRSAETVWNDSSSGNGAGGGGLSGFWCMPSYQYKTAIPGLISNLSRTNGACPAAVAKHIRQSPDVSADADPQTGYVIRHKGRWIAIGGTSAAAPLWASVAALIDASPFCKDYGSGQPGVLPKPLYAMTSLDHTYIYETGRGAVPEVFYDVRQGNNDYTPSGFHGGLFPARRGYDMASGLGTPLVTGIGAHNRLSNFYPGLAGVMCEWFAKKLKTVKVTHITPSHGSVRGGTRVTVTGSGFLPISGADMALIGTRLVAARCSSTTKCTVVMPRHTAGTVNIRISAEDFGFSKITRADRFTYR
jgi:subtilase family serine protease